MKVENIMSRDVITATPDMPVHAAARRMVDHGVSGLPVVDDSGRLVGVVTEGDLIVRQKPREHVPWWRLFFDDPERLAHDYQKSAGTTVGEIMTRSVISVGPEMPIESVAAILDRNHVRRLPVLENGALVGVVSRGDLIKALASAPGRDQTPRPDAQLVRDMESRLAAEPWTTRRGIVVHADKGVLVLWGLVATPGEKSALETMARSLPGVRGIDSHLVVRSDFPYHYGAA
jgi:CBS domain-containing protein